MAVQVLSGRYRIVRHLARGGMAEVYLAHDQLLDRPVAVKVLFPQLARDSSFVERFRHEAQSAARLNHPNIVSVYDFGEDQDGDFIVMEYVAGPTLGEVIATNGPMPPSQAIDLGADIAAALAAAHREGIIHRDVKPANVLIADGVAKVADFGIARAVDARAGLTMPGMIIGTANYLSPEQAQGQPVDHRSDLYSLGMVLYEMLTGAPPFTGDNPVTVAYKQQHESALPPSSHNPAVTPGLDAIVAKLLSLRPQDRQSSADEVRAQLLATEGQPRAGRPTVAFGMAETTVVPVESAGHAEGGAMGAAAGLAAGAAGGAGRVGAASAPTAIAPIAGAGGRAGAGGPHVASRTAPSTPRAVFRRRRMVVLGALVLVLLAAVAGVLALSGGSGTTSATVPRVVGFSITDAMAKLSAAGLKSQVVKSDLPGVIDQVIQQIPIDGSQARRGDTVSLYVASGTTTTSFPRVTTRPTTRITTPTTVAPTTATHPVTVPATTAVVTTVPVTRVPLPTTPTT